MSTKQAPNRAQRRKEARRAAAPHLSFWKSNAAVVIIGLGVVALTIGGMAAYRQSQAAPVPETPAASQPAQPVQPQPAQPAQPAPVPDSGEVTKTDVKVGTGKEAKPGDKVRVHYTGTLTNGTEFDSSKTHGQPFEFVIGSGQVIKGWDLGVAGMKEGGTRKLVIPPSLGYGTANKGKIPPNSTLNFDIELLKVDTPGTSDSPAAPSTAPPSRDDASKAPAPATKKPGAKAP